MAVPSTELDAVPVHVNSLTVAVQITSKSPSSGKVYTLPVWEMVTSPLPITRLLEPTAQI